VLFEAEAARRQVTGSGGASFIGWALTLTVMFDALLNVRGSGAVSMLVTWALLSSSNISNVTITSLVISILQGCVLALGASFLMASPWRRWLRTALRETWAAQPAARLTRAVFAGQQMSRLGDADALRIARDAVLFTIGCVLLEPAIASAFAGRESTGIFVLILCLVLSYGMTTLGVAVFSKARYDSASAAGLIAGCIVPSVAAAYALPVDATLHVAPLAINEFTYYQLGVLGVAILGLWLVHLGSVADSELLVITLGGAPTGVLRELPDLTLGAYQPFQFRVRSNGEKVVLLSRPVKEAKHYQIHSTLDPHDPMQGQWVLLNLSELERTIGPLSITRQGQTRYLECQIDFRLATAVPEQFNDRLRADVVLIPVEDISNVQSQMFTGSDVIGQLRQQFDTLISNQLDAALLASPFGAVSVTSLTSILAQMRLHVSQLKQTFDVQVAAFRASAGTGLRLDRADEISNHLVEAFKNVVPLMRDVRAAYEDASRLDQGIAATRSRLQADLIANVKAAMNRMVSGAGRGGNAGQVATVKLIDLVELTVQSADIRPTAEAQTLHQEITTLYTEAEAHWSQASAEMGAIAKEHGDTVRTQLNSIINGQMPSAVRNWGLGMLAGANASPPGGLPLHSQPIYQRTQGGAGSPRNSATAPTATPGASPPIYQRTLPVPAASQNLAPPAPTPPAAQSSNDPFPD
jgi:hypothetical protein